MGNLKESIHAIQDQLDASRKEIEFNEKMIASLTVDKSELDNQVVSVKRDLRKAQEKSKEIEEESSKRLEQAKRSAKNIEDQAKKMLRDADVKLIEAEDLKKKYERLVNKVEKDSREMDSKRKELNVRAEKIKALAG
jgi:chromosome segregation ATPase